MTAGMDPEARRGTERKRLTTKYPKHTKKKNAGKDFTTESTELAKPKAWGAEKNREEGLEEIARRYLLQPVEGFPPG